MADIVEHADVRCGWSSPAIVCASRSSRAFISTLSEKCAGRTLIATVRFSRVSRALYTSPCPPTPMAERISYGRSFAPTAKVMVSASRHLEIGLPVEDHSDGWPLVGLWDERQQKPLGIR